MPDRTGIFLGWSANLSNFLGLGVEAGASPMYPQKMRVPPPPLGLILSTLEQFIVAAQSPDHSVHVHNCLLGSFPRVGGYFELLRRSISSVITKIPGMMGQRKNTLYYHPNEICGKHFRIYRN